MKATKTKKRGARDSRKKPTAPRQGNRAHRRKDLALTKELIERQVRLDVRSTDNEKSRAPIDSLTGDLPAVTLKDTTEVLRHFERVDPRLAEAWRRDVVVHEGPITLRRVMSPVNFGGATHYAYVDRRLLWYLRHDPSNPAGARWEGYLAKIGDAPAGTVGVSVGNNLVVKRCPPRLEGAEGRSLGDAPSTGAPQASGDSTRGLDK